MSYPNTPPPGVYQPQVPKPSSPTVLGAINVALGALLLLWGLWALATYALMPYMSSFMEANMRQVEDQFEQERQQELG